jgi:uncharacterized membrane protein YgdD (TMEM256/DUF423 family)
MRAVIAISAIYGFLAVAFGAWSAHGASAVLDAQALAWLHTAVEYEAWHASALLAAGILMAIRPGRFLSPAALFFALGILLFSGSLYALALTGRHGFAMATPVGGSLLLIGWVLLGCHALALDRRR